MEPEHRLELGHVLLEVEHVLARHLKVEVVLTNQNVSFTFFAFKSNSYSGNRVFLSIPEEHPMDHLTNAVATDLTIPMHFRLTFEEGLIHIFELCHQRSTLINSLNNSLGLV